MDAPRGSAPSPANQPTPSQVPTNTSQPTLPRFNHPKPTLPRFNHPPSGRTNTSQVQPSTKPSRSVHHAPSGASTATILGGQMRRGGVVVPGCGTNTFPRSSTKQPTPSPRSSTKQPTNTSQVQPSTKPSRSVHHAPSGACTATILGCQMRRGAVVVPGCGAHARGCDLTSGGLHQCTQRQCRQTPSTSRQWHLRTGQPTRCPSETLLAAPHFATLRTPCDTPVGRHGAFERPLAMQSE